MTGTSPLKSLWQKRFGCSYRIKCPASIAIRPVDRGLAMGFKKKTVFLYKVGPYELYKLVVEPTHLKNITKSNWIIFPKDPGWKFQKMLELKNHLYYKWTYSSYINDLIDGITGIVSPRNQWRLLQPHPTKISGETGPILYPRLPFPELPQGFFQLKVTKQSMQSYTFFKASSM